MKTALSSQLAFYVALAAVAAVALGLVTALAGWLRPYAAFRLFGAGLALGGLASLVLGLIALWATRGDALGRGQAWLALAIGFAFVTFLLIQIWPARGVPPIHDITTDPEDPPTFSVAARHPDNEGRDLTYPHGGAGVPDAQRAAYPDLAPIRLSLSADEAYEAARNAAEAMGWRVTWTNGERRVIEAEAESKTFKFVDDIAIRVREEGTGSVIDVRSTSRAGVSDLGANAARIRAFTQQLTSP